MKSKVIKLIPNNSLFPLMPYLEAFAIEYCILNIDGIIYHEESEFFISDRVEAKILVPDNASVHLHIFFHGIKDFKRLFFFIDHEDECSRLARYYEEAENCITSGSWLSYALCCSGIFEGILRQKFRSQKMAIPTAISKGRRSRDLTFGPLITQAFNERLINTTTKKIMNRTRDARNCIHPGANGKLISRKDAYEIRSLMDKLIMADWH